VKSIYSNHPSQGSSSILLRRLTPEVKGRAKKVFAELLVFAKKPKNKKTNSQTF